MVHPNSRHLLWHHNGNIIFICTESLAAVRLVTQPWPELMFSFIYITRHCVFVSITKPREIFFLNSLCPLEWLSCNCLLRSVQFWHWAFKRWMWGQYAANVTENHPVLLTLGVIRGTGSLPNTERRSSALSLCDIAACSGSLGIEMKLNLQ